MFALISMRPHKNQQCLLGHGELITSRVKRIQKESSHWLYVSGADGTKCRRCSECLTRQRNEIITTRVEVSEEHAEEIEDAGLTVEIVTLYCEEFGGDPSSVSLSEVGDAFEGVFANEKEFAREVAMGCGPDGFAEGSWPATCIDWERATSELMESYVEVDGCYFAVG